MKHFGIRRRKKLFGGPAGDETTSALSTTPPVRLSPAPMDASSATSVPAGPAAHIALAGAGGGAQQLSTQLLSIAEETAGASSADAGVTGVAGESEAADPGSTGTEDDVDSGAADSVVVADRQNREEASTAADNATNSDATINAGRDDMAFATAPDKDGLAQAVPPTGETMHAHDTVSDPVPVTETPITTEPPSAAGNPNLLDAAGDTPLATEIADLARRRSALAAEKLPLPATTRIFTVANQKGGVGKTTTAVNLAAALARGGSRVLVIDLDPQGNASTALGVDHRADRPSVYNVIINDEPISGIVQKSPEFEGLYCLPATIHLAGAEIELVSMVAREQRLRTPLLRYLSEVSEPFHYVFIDCPPSLGLLTINAFVAASEVLIPIQCEYYALEGLSQLLSNISLIERHLNPTLTVSTILLTMFDARTNLANQVAQDVRDHFPDQVLPTLIPRSVRISEAPSYGQTVISYDTNSTGSLSYREAAAEIARRGAPN